MDEGLLDQDGSWEPAGEGLWGDKSNTEDLKVFHDQVCAGVLASGPERLPVGARTSPTLAWHAGRGGSG